MCPSTRAGFDPPSESSTIVVRRNLSITNHDSEAALSVEEFENTMHVAFSAITIFTQ